MITKNDIHYPICFVSHGVGTFTQQSEFAGFVTDRDGNVRDYDNQTVVHFINQHNTHNPTNKVERDYYYFYPEESQGVGECPVEDMPLGARLTGVRQEDGVWIGLSVQPKRIEVDGETVTFLLHQHYKRAAFAGEVSMKRRTMIRWSK